MSSASTAANTMWLFIGTYVARSLTPSFSANSGIWPAPSAESFRTVSFADGQRSGGCCPTIRYCTELLLCERETRPYSPWNRLCRSSSDDLLDACCRCRKRRSRASLNQPPHPVLGELEWRASSRLTANLKPTERSQDIRSRR